ncbi:MAG: tripartite tricarboxylate transporter TctB family protein [Streptosporangiales bacterium]|nr:tripartite tricarboxylate transporter TctB family protein [Streptosporangiales bacterium]
MSDPNGGQATSSVLRSGTLWAGVLVAVAGGVGIAGGLQVPDSGALSDPLGPRAFPIGLGAAALVLGALLAISARTEGVAGAADTGRRRTVAVLAGAIVLYVALLIPLGYPLTTVVFLGLLFRYLGERRWWACAAIAVPVTAALYLGFAYGLGVALPTGPLGF